MQNVHRYYTKIICFFIIPALLFALAGHAGAAVRTTRTITYYADQSVTVPAEITRIANGWPAQNSIIAMLGYGDKIVATYDMIKADPNFNHFVPGIQKAVACFSASGEVNIESLAGANPDIIFVPSARYATDKFKRIKQLGLPVAAFKANSFRNLIERTVITGEILGPQAHRHALRYKQYFERNQRLVSQRVARITPDKRMKVFHCLGSPLTSAGAPSLVQDWMDSAGVINVARDWNTIRPDQGSPVSNMNLEQIIAADPDVIVCMSPAHKASILADPAWSVITAVREGKVYTNPKGLFWWCRETTEEAMQFLWLAKTAYPEQFKDIDIERETRYFYKTFYRIDLTDEDVELFLHPR